MVQYQSIAHLAAVMRQLDALVKGGSRCKPCMCDVQAVNAVQTFNGTELAGRKILVREDREDRDVKQYNKDNGIEPPEREPRPPRRERRPRESQNNRSREDGPSKSDRRAQETTSSGLQVCQS